MRIALDFDDVLVDFTGAFLRYQNEKLKTDYKRENLRNPDFEEFFGWTREEKKKKVERFFNSSYAKKMEPVEGARIGVQKLLREGHELSVITSRIYGTLNNAEHLINKYFFNSFSFLLFTNDYYLKFSKKSEFCKEISADLIVEDKLANAEECARKGIDALLLDCPWNQEENLDDGIYRVYGWEGILEKIESYASLRV